MRIAKGRMVYGQIRWYRGEDGGYGDDWHKLRGFGGAGEIVGVWKGEDGEDGVGNGSGKG